MADADPRQTGRRLRALQKLAKCATVDDLARLIGAERSRVSNWLNGYYLPPVPQTLRLIDKAEEEADLRGITLDWLYLGNSDSVPVRLGIRLAALEASIPVPAVAPEPEGEPEEAPPVAARPARRKASRKQAT